MTRPLTVSARVDEETRSRLDELARKKRMETGEDIRLGDLVRVALKEYLERELPKPQ